jgi:LPXTG-motif cell wall-anchored protein
VDYLAFTDAAGTYSIDHLPAGEYRLVMVSNAGLATTPLTEDVTLLPGQAYDQGIFGFASAALPSTGLNARTIAWWGMLLVAAGVGALWPTRRRSGRREAGRTD